MPALLVTFPAPASATTSVLVVCSAVLALVLVLLFFLGCIFLRFANRRAAHELVDIEVSTYNATTSTNNHLLLGSNGVELSTGEAPLTASTFL